MGNEFALFGLLLFPCPYSYCCSNVTHLFSQFEQALDRFTTMIDTEGSSSSGGGRGRDDTEESVASAAPGPPPAQAQHGSVAAAIAAALSIHGLLPGWAASNNTTEDSNSSTGDSSSCGNDSGATNLAAAVNNLSICSLYVKQIRTAIGRLEQLIAAHPARHLTDPVVFNLCTLYDLSYAPEASALKKKLLQKVAYEYHVDDPILHWRSFRLS